MRIPRVLRPSLLVTLLLLSGCANVMEAIKDVASDRPTASVTGARLLNIGLDALTVEFDIDVANPYSFDLPVLGFDFGLSTQAQPFLSGDVASGGSIPSRGRGTLALPLKVEFRGLLDTVNRLRPGQVVPYDAEIGLKLDVPGTGPLRIPLRHQGEMPIPNAPRVEVASMDWDEVSFGNVGGAVKVGLGNTNEFGFSLSSLQYGLALAGTDVGGGVNETALNLGPGESGQLTIPVAFSPRDVGVAVLNVLAGSTADYQLGGTVTLDSPFGPMELPFNTQGVAPVNR